jgi:F0F1-type ATP synthase assembly protein I
VTNSKGRIKGRVLRTLKSNKTAGNLIDNVEKLKTSVEIATQTAIMIATMTVGMITAGMMIGIMIGIMITATTTRLTPPLFLFS